MPQYRLDLEYDGTDFRGWQIQPEERTVQAELESRLKTLFGQEVRTTAAGRTDTGVHALGQVVSFSGPKSIEPADLAKSLNGMLPPDAVVRKASVAAANFNARFSATKREYVYDIAYGDRAVGRAYAWSRRDVLDLNAMREAAQPVLGHHDFTSFCVAAKERESRDCDIRVCRWDPQDLGLRLTIEANRFVRSMVRSLVGTFVDIGRGFRIAAEMQDILEAKDRSHAGPTAPPHGLFLSRVDYD